MSTVDLKVTPHSFDTRTAMPPSPHNRQVLLSKMPAELPT